MFKKTLLMLAMVGTFSFTAAADANAWHRIRPVRRVVARAVLPPYPMARRVVVGPVYRHPVVYGPSYYATPTVYATPSIYVGTGMYFGY
jgi:hypothetical protein